MLFKRKLSKSGHWFLLYALIFVRFLRRQTDFALTHIFVTRTFYYEYIHVYERQLPNALVMIFNTERGVDLARLRKGAACITYTTTTNSEPVSWHRAEIEGISGERADFECRISVYRLLCHGIRLDPFVDIAKQRIDVKLSQHSSPFQVKVQRADHEPRKFVVCPSRLFVFDQWPLFITAMELYRIHKVDLVLVYIQSVDKEVFRLVKAYQSEGLLQMRPALEMPAVSTLRFNPNSETSWQNQLTNFQDCLYEFRESAQFIAFPDWDDFMFTRQYPIPYHSVLTNLAKHNPTVNTFIVDRYMGVHESLEEMSTNGHSMVDFWRKGIRFSRNETQYFYGKAIYRPNHGLYGVDLHWANRVERGYREMRVPLDQSYMIHARDYSKYKLDGRIRNTLPMERNFGKFVRKHNLSAILEGMPRKEVLTDELNRCLGFNSQGMKAIVEKSASKCWNYHQCRIEKVRRGCVNVQNEWEEQHGGGRANRLPGAIRLFMLTNSDYVEGDICVY